MFGPIVVIVSPVCSQVGREDWTQGPAQVGMVRSQVLLSICPCVLFLFKKWTFPQQLQSSLFSRL